jgi:hypothetical protein
MQIHPLFSVKKAAEVLGVEKQFLREQLENGMIRGEKRRVGERDKWFIYHGEVKDLRDTKRLHELTEKAKRISVEGLTEFFDDDDILEEPKENSLIANFTDTTPLVEESQSLSRDIISAEHNAANADLIDSSSGTTLSSVFSLHMTEGAVELPVKSTDALQQPEPDAPALGEKVFPVVNSIESIKCIELFYSGASPEKLTDTQPEVTGSTSITLDAVLQKLTVEFAYRLAEERSRVCELEHLLDTKEQCLKQLPDLEKRLQAEQAKLLSEQSRLEEEQALRRAHENEVVSLKQRILELESGKSSTKPWWHRLFG